MSQQPPTTSAECARSGGLTAAGFLHLEAVPGSVGAGRRWVVEQVAALGAPDELVLIIELLTSELVTNAVRHGPSAGVITVHTLCDGQAMRVVVTDESEAPPVVCHPGVDDLGGRGLELVEALSNGWGVERHGRGKAVWFRLSLAESAA